VLYSFRFRNGSSVRVVETMMMMVMQEFVLSEYSYSTKKRDEKYYLCKLILATGTFVHTSGNLVFIVGTTP